MHADLKTTVAGPRRRDKRYTDFSGNPQGTWEMAIPKRLVRRMTCGASGSLLTYASCPENPASQYWEAVQPHMSALSPGIWTNETERKHELQGTNGQRVHYGFHSFADNPMLLDRLCGAVWRYLKIGELPPLSCDLTHLTYHFFFSPSIKTVDITGGPPELNPHFRLLVAEIRFTTLHTPPLFPLIHGFAIFLQCRQEPWGRPS